VVRELIRAIQEERKNKNLEPSDKIDIKLIGKTELDHLAHEYKDMIGRITGVVNLFFEEREEENFEIEIL
jgi:valyl-tRNA synthetase